MFDGIREALHKEMHELDEKFSNGAQLNGQELEHIDKMAHALKCLATYDAMQGSDYGYEGESYARGRSRVTGRYVSRDGGYSGGYGDRSMDGGGYRRY